MIALPIMMFAIGLAIAACSGTIDLHMPRPGGAGPSPLPGVRQLVVVTSRDWTSIEGHLQSFERANDAAPWQKVGSDLTVALGRAGMGWGRGRHQSASTNGPIAQEGDGRATAGAFDLGPAFGFASPKEVGPLKIPYLEETDHLECVDDIRSRFYNRIIDRSAVGDVDWSSSEKMSEQGDSYRWGIVIRQNDPPLPGMGSCIFLHSWSSSRGTAGCTGLDPDRMEAMIRWIDAEKKPLLIQLPRNEYEHARRAWQLPALSR